MNSHYEQFTYNDNEQYPHGHPNLHPYYHPCVNPQEVQYTPHPNDMRIGDPLVFNTQPLFHHGFFNRESVALHVDLTYTAGDRLFHDGPTPQDGEREWALHLQPVHDFNHNAAQQNVVGQFMNNPAPVQPTVQALYEDAAIQFSPDEFTNDAGPVQTYDAATPLPIDPQLDGYTPTLHMTPGPGAATPPSPVTPNNIHPPELTCDQCGSTKCNSQESLKRHKDREHGSNVPTYSCPMANCAKSYRSKKETDIKRHIDTFHLNKRQFTCQICNNTFSRKDNYRRHLKDKEGRADLAAEL